jgi:adenylate kinase family enzyme
MRLVVMGNDGSGKTTFAGALASATGLQRISLATVFCRSRPENEQHRLSHGFL